MDLRRTMGDPAPIELAYAPYRLLFKHPFGTAHGLRGGTDAVFVRLRRGEHTGHGEATLPPYLDESVSLVIELIRSIDLKTWVNEVEAAIAGRSVHAAWERSPATRAALVSAYYDLVFREKGILISSSLEIPGRRSASAMVTLGHSRIEDIALKLSELPRTDILKVKLGSPEDQQTLKAVIRLDDRKLFLDANQGWTSADQALIAIGIVGEDRIAGIEQPFAKDRWDLHAQLRQLTPVRIYGDESIQGMADLERAPEAFGGVNIKLMKCGGLDVAKAMAERAGELGLLVMLGSMSESSLGCGAMAQLSGLADLADLDGPWLLANDPFEGLELDEGRMRCAGSAGAGIRLKPDASLAWIHIGA